MKRSEYHSYHDVFDRIVAESKNPIPELKRFLESEVQQGFLNDFVVSRSNSTLNVIDIMAMIPNSVSSFIYFAVSTCHADF